MFVAAHLDRADPGRLLGLWAPPVGGGDEPRRWYPEFSAAETSAWESLQNKAPDATWEELLRSLPDRLPYFIWWEGVEVDDDVDLDALFAELAPLYKASAEALHGKDLGDSELTVKMLSPTADALAHAADAPEKLAEAIGAPTTPFRSAMKLSTRMSFFCDNDLDGPLCVIGRAGTAADADLALAYGLAHCGDRELWLVLPEVHVKAAIWRAPWIAQPLRIFSYGSQLTEHRIPAPKEVQALWPAGIRVEEHEIGLEREAWIGPLLAWAHNTPGIVPAHRPSYLSWLCDGRAVLTVQGGGAGSLRITGGLHTTKEGSPDRVDVVIGGPCTTLDLHRLIAAASATAVKQLDGTDQANAEHRLQAALHPRLFGLTSSWHREFPAMRPPKRRGYLDFLGFEDNGTLHVVETKIGPDELLAVQALDYWIWATLHATDILAALNRPAQHKPRVVLDLVIAEKQGQYLSPYTAAQLEALSNDIRIRCWKVTFAENGTPTVTRFDPTTTRGPDLPRRWHVALQQHLSATGGSDLIAGAMHKRPHDNLLSGAHAAHDTLASAGLTHDYVHHVRSSQAFALNLFAPLDPAALRAILHLCTGHDIAEVDPAAFEWIDPNDRLGEGAGNSTHRTQIDVFLSGTDHDGQRRVALIEVKLSEVDFSTCSAYSHAKNDRLDICAQPLPFGGEPNGCFQLRNCGHGGPDARRNYDKYLGLLPETSSGVGCWFADGTNQIMRQTALARSIVEHGDAATCCVVLCAPASNRTVHRRFHAASELFSALPNLSFRTVNPSSVAKLHPVKQGIDLIARYVLDAATPDTIQLPATATPSDVRAAPKEQAHVQPTLQSQATQRRSDIPLLHCDEPVALRAIARWRDIHPGNSLHELLETALRSRRISEIAFKRHSKWCHSKGKYSAGVDPARDTALAMYGFVPERLEGNDGRSDTQMQELLREYRRRLEG